MQSELSVIPATDSASESGFHKAFEARVQATPDKPALVINGQKITYQMINDRANRLASYLLEHVPSRYVAAHVKDGMDQLITLVAACKVGKPCLLVSHRTPAALLLTYLQQTDDVALITDQAVELPLPIVHLNELTLPPVPNFVSNPAKPDDIMYILSTSGSTGVPKGLARTHGTYLMGTGGGKWGGPLQGNEKCLIIGDLAAAASLNRTLNYLLAGVCCYFVNLYDQQIEDIKRLMNDVGITYLRCTPSAFRTVFADPSPYEFPKLQTIDLSSEPVLRSDFELFKGRFKPPTKFQNSYGITETGLVAKFSATHETIITTDTLPVGKSMPDTEVMVVNEQGQKVIGELGEIQFRSPFMSLGYWNNPDLTAQKFLPDPQGGKWRIYRTGDLGMILPDGNLLHLGRMDLMVKIRGFRVELAAIETRLMAHEAIHQVVVNPYKIEENTYLAAYLVSKHPNPPSKGELRQFLLQILPDYMVPSAFVFLEALPVLAGGKVDRSRLPNPATVAQERTTVTPPTTATELKIAAIWQQVLKQAIPLDVHDVFFELGGDSLQAGTMISQINKAFDVTLTPAILYRHPALGQLASLIDRNDMKEMLPDSLILLQPKGTHLPVFSITGALGNPLAFKRLTEHLGEDYPLYSFQLPGSNGKQPLVTDFHDIADHYVAAIKSLELRVPIYVMGFSVGGILAMMVAQRLKQEGVLVNSVILIDTQFSSEKEVVDSSQDERDLKRRRLWRRWLRIRKRFRALWNQTIKPRYQRSKEMISRAIALLRMSSEDRRQWWAERPMRQQAAMQYDPLAHYELFYGFESKEAKALAYKIAAVMQAGNKQFKLAPYAGDVVYFKSTSRYTPNNGLDPSDVILQRAVLGQFRVIPVSGQHLVLLNDPSVGELANHLKTIIQPASYG